jgi:protein serine kinase H
MTDERWEGVSVEAKDFIRRLLALDPGARPTAEAALRHPWLQSIGDFSASTQTTTRTVQAPDHGRATTVTKTTTSTTERVNTRTTRRSIGGLTELIASDSSPPTHRRVSHEVVVRR